MTSPMIDIVIPWVDGSDPAWLNEKKRTMEKVFPDMDANTNIRYQNWENLQYWFRAVEKYMPWVNKVFFVTWGHIPSFLNTEHPKLRVVKHSDYIPEEYLPTFNSNTIEMNYWRIEDLSENFILFNDDFFVIRPVAEEYYFKNNKVCDEAVESPIIPVSKDKGYRHFCMMQLNNVTVINRHFKKREVQKDNFWKWFYPGYGEVLKRNIGLHYWYNFVGFRDPHVPSAMKKSTLKHLWEVEPEVLHHSSGNQFRADSDISQYLIRYWQLCTGDFHPRKSTGKYFAVDIYNYKEVAEAIRKRKWHTVVLNENCTPEEFEVIKAEINAAFEEILPEKSSFEK